MDSHRLRRNLSQSDLMKLITESQKRADYINKITDNDIHFHMMTESYSPLKERLKYINSEYNINNKNYVEPNTQRIVRNNYNQINLSGYYPSKTNQPNENIIEEDKYYINKNNNLYNSLNVNKPFHREKKHFPLINNKGNFFRIENTHLIKRKIINNNYFSNNENDYNKKRINTYNYGFNKYNDTKFRCYNNYNQYKNNSRISNLRRNDSMLNMSNHFPRIKLKNKMNDEIIKFKNNEESEEDNPNSRNENHYSPRRYDYEGSRFGDNTYNFYLNEPMRGDASVNWKFPPLYMYNSKIDYGKSFPDY